MFFITFYTTILWFSINFVNLEASYCEAFHPCGDVNAQCIDTFSQVNNQLPYLCICPHSTLGYPDCRKNATDFIISETKMAAKVANSADLVPSHPMPPRPSYCNIWHPCGPNVAMCLDTPDIYQMFTHIEYICICRDGTFGSPYCNKNILAFLFELSNCVINAFKPSTISDTTKHPIVITTEPFIPTFFEPSTTTTEAPVIITDPITTEHTAEPTIAFSSVDPVSIDTTTTTVVTTTDDFFDFETTTTKPDCTTEHPHKPSHVNCHCSVTIESGSSSSSSSLEETHVTKPTHSNHDDIFDKLLEKLNKDEHYNQIKEWIYKKIQKYFFNKEKKLHKNI